MKTLADLRTQLQFMLGNRGFPDTQLDNWITQGYYDLTSQHLFEQKKARLEQTVAVNGTTVPVPPDTAGILEVYSEENLLVRVEDAASANLDTDDTGNPRFWYYTNQTINLIPKARVAVDVTVIYTKNDNPFTSATSTSDLSPIWDRVIELLAAYHALVDLEEADRAAYFFQIAQTEQNKRIEREFIQGQTTPMPVQAIDSWEELNGTSW